MDEPTAPDADADLSPEGLPDAPPLVKDELTPARWPAGTSIALHSVPWDAEYRDVPMFFTTEERGTYFRRQFSAEDRIGTAVPEPLILRRAAWIRPGQPIVLPIPYETAVRYNYIVAVNGDVDDYPHGPRNPVDRQYYYFIRSMAETSPGHTAFELQLDIWVTYSTRALFGRMHIVRGHIGIAAQHHDVPGSSGEEGLYLDAPEGLDIGNDLVTVAAASYNVMTGRHYADAADADVATTLHPHYLVVSAGQVSAHPGENANETGDGDTLDRIASSRAPSPTSVGGVILPVTMRIFTGGYFQAFVQQLSRNPFTAASIIGVYAIPNSPEFIGKTDRWLGLPCNVPRPDAFVNFVAMRPNWRYDNEILRWFGPRYRHLRKFLTWPFMAIEASYGTTSRLLYPQSWRDNNAQMAFHRSVFPNASEYAVPLGYGQNAYVWGPGTWHTTPHNAFWRSPKYRYRHFGDSLQYSIPFASQVALPISTHAGALAAASSAHSRAASLAAADWGRQKSLAAADAAYAAAERGVGAASYALERGQAADRAVMAQQHGYEHRSALFGGIASTAQGAAQGGQAMMGLGPKAVAGGAAIGGVTAAAGAAFGAANMADRQMTDSRVQAIQHQAALDASGAMAGASLANAGANRALAHRAAQGDYEHQVRAIHAAEADARLQPQGLRGGIPDITMLTTGETTVVLKWKTLSQANVRAVGEHWLRYGYALGEWWNPDDHRVSSLMVMERLTYLRAAEARVYGPIPDEARQVIRGMLERGVTFWRPPHHIEEGITFPNPVRYAPLIDG